jgi:hypothetical protein
MIEWDEVCGVTPFIIIVHRPPISDDDNLLAVDDEGRAGRHDARVHVPVQTDCD